VRTRLSIGLHEIQALHVVGPGPLDLVTVANPPQDGQDLPPLPWFGPKVSAESAYQRRRLALDDAPAASETEITNAALNSLLDFLEDRFTTWPLPRQAVEPDTPAADMSSPRLLPCPLRIPRPMRRLMILASRTRSFASGHGLCSQGRAESERNFQQVACHFSLLQSPQSASSHVQG
jgi:hypothetical protein